MGDIFKVGEPIPKVWLHMEFDFNDTTKYMNGTVIGDNKELQRLVDKYLIERNGESYNGTCLP